MEKSDLSRQIQTLEIELASQQSLVSMRVFKTVGNMLNIYFLISNHVFCCILYQKASLEDTLRNAELRNNMEMEKYNAVLIRLEEELTNLRANIQQQTQEYEALLNMKMKLEAEIAIYKNLLDGEDFK